MSLTLTPLASAEQQLRRQEARLEADLAAKRAAERQAARAFPLSSQLPQRQAYYQPQARAYQQSLDALRAAQQVYVAAGGELEFRMS